MRIDLLKGNRIVLANWIYEHIGERVQELRAEPFSKIEAICKKNSGCTLDVTANEMLTIIAAYSMTSNGCWVHYNFYKYEHPENLKSCTQKSKS